MDNLDKLLAILTILGFILALPGFFLLFFDGNSAIAILCICVGILLILIAFFLWEQNKPEIVLHSVSKELKFLNNSRDVATLTHIVIGKVNRQTSQLTVGKVASDGAITNIKVNGNPYIGQVLGGQRNIAVQFTPPLQKNNIFNALISFDVNNGFLGQREGVVHVTEYFTKELTYRITFPDNENLFNYTAILKFPGKQNKRLNDLTLVGRTCLEFKAKNMKPGQVKTTGLNGIGNPT